MATRERCLRRWRSKLAGSACLSVLLLLLPVGTTASAEIVHFTSGRFLSVKSVKQEGSSLVLTLRSGGEVVCDAALVSRIEPDEVPWPESTATQVVSPRASDYAAIVEKLSASEGIDPMLVKAVVQVESAWQPRALSPKGAMGLMQLMPETARQYAVKDPYDPVDNISAGIRHLKSLLQRFELSLALAAYNAGEGAVLRHGGIPPYAETRAYVARVLVLLQPTN
jgi:hypothetical protein